MRMDQKLLASVASKEHISINDATDATTNDDDVTTVSQNNLTERLDVTKGSKRLPTSTVVSSSTAAATTTTTTKLKKNPNAPKRFKSAFIIFSAEKHKEIRAGLSNKGVSEKTTNVAKLVSEEWRGLSSDEREVWEEKARKDKARYQVEKAMYKGPWKVPNLRKQKHPNAPKRPMSAFLAFSNSRRASIKRSNPTATNADISKTLSKMWKEAPGTLRKKYLDEEAKLRNEYKIRIAEWRRKAAEEEDAQRKEREDIARKTAAKQANDCGYVDGKSTPDAAPETRVAATATASQPLPHSIPATAKTQHDVDGNVTLPQQQQQQQQQHQLNYPVGLNQVLMDQLISSGSLAPTTLGIGLPSILRGNIAGIHHHNALTEHLNNLLQGRGQLNEGASQLPSISETYQAMLPSLLGEGRLSHLPIVQDQQQTLANLAARLSEGLEETKTREQRNISEYLRSATNSMYPNFGVGTNMLLGGMINDSIRLRNFPMGTSGQMPMTQDVTNALLLQDQLALGVSGFSNLSQQNPRDGSNSGNQFGGAPF